MEFDKRLVLAALVIMFGSNAADIYSFTNHSDPRPDPFTGVMGKELENRIELRIQDQEREIRILEKKIYSDASEFQRELNKLENKSVKSETLLNECLRKVR